MPCTPIFTSGPVNPGREFDRLTGRQVDKCEIPLTLCTPIFTLSPVNPGRQVDRSTGEQVLNTYNALHSYIYLSTFLTINLSLFTAGPVNPGRQVDRSTSTAYP